MKLFEYRRAASVREACRILVEYGGKARVIAGGTDLFVSMKSRKAAPECLVDIKEIRGLEGISQSRGLLRIGAVETLDSIEADAFVRDRFPVLASAVHKIAVPAIRNAATLGGNLCNAAPSADSAPPLVALGARVRISSQDGEREVPLEQFFLGPGKTALAPGEIVTQILVPLPRSKSRGAYLKMTPRNASGIALVGVAVLAWFDGSKDRLEDIRIVLGAVAPTPIRANAAEDILKSSPLSARTILQASEAAASAARPITDVRGSKEYRRAMVQVLTRKALEQALSIKATEDCQ